MRLVSRIDKLEKQNDNGFRILVGTPLNAEGELLQPVRDSNDIATFRFRHHSEFIVVHRNEDESLGGFTDRAYREAAKIVRPTVCVYWGVR